MHNKSFTLIEILTVILIVGVLSGIIIVATNSVIDSTQDAKRKKDLDAISKVLLEYGVMTGSYPVEASDCDIGDGTCLDELIDSGYARNFPLDPSGTRYKYSSDGITYTIKALLSDNQTLAYNPDTGYSQYTGLVGWTKRKSITINSSASLTDYQVKVDVTYDSDMLSNFDDIRFTSGDGITELNYWIESKTDNVSAVVWVRTDSLSIGDNTFYMYYGNASVSSASSGANTFYFFDDFSDGNYTSNPAWTVVSGTFSAVNGYLEQTKTFTGLTIYSSISIPSDKKIMVEFDATWTSTWAIGNNMYIKDSGGNLLIGGGGVRADYNGDNKVNTWGSPSLWGYTVYSIPTGTHNFKVYYDSGASSYKTSYKNGTIINTLSGSYYSGTPSTIYLDGWQHQAGSKFDNIRVRQYVSDPTFSFGSEESL